MVLSLLQDKRSGYPLIDYYRIIAAVFVIIIHTIPLESILLKAIVRTAVPFFFITTSYFYFLNSKPLAKLIKDLLIIYGLAILLYLPLNIYNYDKFKILTILKNLFIDGTFYHLWYLPATIMGLIIVDKLIKYLSLKLSFVIVLILYLIGLGGDSYYGLVINYIPSFYQLIFSFCDYTRNGIFFAPIFIYLGYLLAIYPAKVKKINLKMMISFILMLLEIMILNHYQISKHDAMFLMLPIFMFYSYHWLLRYPGMRRKFCKDLSLLMYLLHPWVIVLVRIISRHSTVLFVENTKIHFLIVTLVTFLISIIGLQIWRWADGK